jgi:hypothetical protein
MLSGEITDCHPANIPTGSSRIDCKMQPRRRAVFPALQKYPK